MKHTYRIPLIPILFLIFIILLSCIAFLVSHPRISDKKSYAGYYSHGTITLWPTKTNNLDEYIGMAKHEWAHYYWDKISPKGFLKKWQNTIKICGIETEYAKTYRNTNIKIEEEFAECFRLKNCCSAKMEIIKQIS